MKNYRYGKFTFRDYYLSWVGISLLLFFSISSVILKLPFILIVFPAVYASLWLWKILSPHREQFVLHDNAISIFHGKKSQTIVLPSELIIVVSHVDICPPLTTRTAFGKQTHILKSKCAVSILQKMPLNAVLETLHLNYVSTYTTSMIEMNFDEHLYIYSFVCEQFLLEKLTANRNCQIIIPESLSKILRVTNIDADVYVDKGY